MKAESQQIENIFDEVILIRMARSSPRKMSRAFAKVAGNRWSVGQWDFIANMKE
ncbi:hypothetical protein [Peribacillus simplex]|uniref:hypothetical protein n=1 Tax=Peribacillus simplex TaxID=1478 RepID=UPI003672CDD2